MVWKQYISIFAQITRFARPAVNDNPTLIVCPATACKTYSAEPEAASCPLTVAEGAPEANTMRFGPFPPMEVAVAGTIVVPAAVAVAVDGAVGVAV